LVIAVIAIGTLFSAFERASQPGPAAPGPAGKIAFNSDRNGNVEIYVMNADGSGQTNVSHGPGDITSGAWSPDGSRIAFTSDRDGNLNVYVVNADGSGLTNVSNDPCTDGLLAWSPDSSRIAFISGGRFGPPQGYATLQPAPAGCPSTIDVVNADGSGLTNVTTSPGDDNFGAWSPDGARIAFTSDRTGNDEMYVVNADGSGLTNLSNNPSDQEAFTSNPSADGPVWSPDSSRIRFTSVRDGSLDLYVMNADGSGVTRLTNVARLTHNPAVDESIWFPSPTGGPVWSPDGSRIAFIADRPGDGNGAIYVVNADGSGLTNLSNSPGSDGVGAWSLDGSRIAFTSNRDGNTEIYVVNADGSGFTNLTNNPGEDGGPVWLPAG
jgi:Tol biopolymer transport system component